MLPRSGATATADRSPRRAVAVVVGVVFVALLGFGIVIPILPFYVRSFGVSNVFIGLLAASYSLAQFGAAPLLGRLSDERGRRPVLLLSMAGSAVAWTLLGLGMQFGALFGAVGGLAALFTARTVAGAIGGNVAAAQAYIADVTPRSERTGALGLVGAAFGLGFVFGPGLGAVFASDPVVAAAGRLLPAFVPATRFSVPSFAAAGCSLLAVLASAALVTEPDRVRTQSQVRGLVAGFRAALADAALRPLVVVFLVYSVAFSGVTVVFIPFVADVYGYGTAEAMLLLTYIGALGVLNQGVLVRLLARRFVDSSLAVGGAVLLLTALATLPFAPVFGPALVPTVAALLGVLGLLSVGNGLLSVGAAALVSGAATEERQGTAFGVIQGAGSLGRTVGPPVMTGLYVLATAAPFLLGTVLMVGVIALLVGVARGSAGVVPAD